MTSRERKYHENNKLYKFFVQELIRRRIYLQLSQPNPKYKQGGTRPDIQVVGSNSLQEIIQTSSKKYE